ncbi:MAG: BON domain-containing protein, partial [Chloroflexi bacterium]
VREDADLVEDVQHLIATYPPATMDRDYLFVEAKDGVVTLRGHTHSRITRRYLEDQVPRLPFVRDVNVDELYDDDTLRLQIGRATPAGVQVAQIYYGRVVLAGKVPEGYDEAHIVEKVAAIPGVVKVLTAFRD